MTRRTVALAAFVAATLAVTGPYSAAQSQSKGKGKGPPTGPIDPVGMPEKFEPGKGPVYALWFEDGFWHLRATANKGEKAGFSGSVNCAKGQVSVRAAGADKASKPQDADYIIPHKDGSGFDFRFVSIGGSDGVDFKTSAANAEFSFHLLIAKGEQPKRVLIGEKMYRPEKIPFTLPANPGK